jgi:hypothetical protein
MSSTPDGAESANENFEDWYSKAFTDTEVSTFNPLEAIRSPDGALSGFTQADRADSPVTVTENAGKATTRIFGNQGGDTDLALVEVRLISAYLHRLISAYLTPPPFDFGLQELTLRCQRICELEIQLNAGEEAQGELEKLNATHETLQELYMHSKQIIQKQKTQIDRFKRRDQAQQDNITGLAAVIAELAENNDNERRTSGVAGESIRAEERGAHMLVEYDVMLEKTERDGIGIALMLDENKVIADRRY